jgi:hypothetical protein
MLTCAVLCVGCGPTIVPNPDPVEMTFNVKQGGKPLNDFTFNLQPIAEGAQSLGKIERGVAKLYVMPGTYTYYISAGTSEAALDSIPAAFHNGAMDRKLEINSGTTIDISID